MNDNKEIQAVRAALMQLLDELDKIENGDEEATMHFCYKVDKFVDMNPGLMVQMPIYRNAGE